MPEQPLKLGLVGIGRWGRNYVRTIAELGSVRLAAVASRNPQAAALVPPDCRIVSSWQNLVTAPDLDGIIIASPPCSHANILLAAIEAAKPVLIEKPIVRTHVEAESIRNALKDRRAIILVDHIHLFNPAFRALLREAASAPIRGIKASSANHGPYRDDVPVLWDWAPHDLAMCLTLVPGPARVFRAVRSDPHPVGKAMAERLTIDLQLAGDVQAHIQLSNMDDRHRWFAVECNAGTLVFRDLAPEPLMRFAPGTDIHGPSGHAIPVSEERPLTRVVLDFTDMIRTGNFDRSSVDLGLAVVDLIADIEARLGHG